MYKVVRFEGNSSCIRILFRSSVEQHCWEFVKGQNKSSVMDLIVTDKTDEFIPVPEDVRALRNYYRVIEKII